MNNLEGYNYQRPRELASSKNFAVEYAPTVTREEIRDDIISYLGEFRFGLKTYDYQLVFSHTNDEGWRLRDPHRFEAMSIKAQRSIGEKRQRREGSIRETAEASGLNLLDRQLQTADEGNSIVWASPPGNLSDGYGAYGFFFIGRIGRDIANKREIAMTAIRVNGLNISDYEKAFKILTGVNFDFKTAEDFLRMPLVVNAELSRSEVLNTLAEIFPNQENASSNSNEFRTAIARVEPRIQQFIDYCAFATPVEKRKAFHALESYFLEIKEEIKLGKKRVYERQRDFTQLVTDYGDRQLPEVKGSCPITNGGRNSANMLNNRFGILNNFLDQEGFVCPRCGYKADGPVGNTCPPDKGGCGLTKEEYAAQTGVSCD